MKPTTQIWGLWKCEELLSVHLTQIDACDAMDEHLAARCCFVDDLDAICASVEIRAIRLSAETTPVENRNPSECAGDDGSATFGRASPAPASPVEGHA